MAWNVGQGGFTSGTGTEIVNLGMSGITSIILEHGSSTTKHARGYVMGGSQYCFSDDASNSTNHALEIKNTSGTVVFRADWQSQLGTNHTFNKTINTLGTVNVTFAFGNV